MVLHRRTDSGNWALPGGRMEIGETVAGSAVREVREETGFEVRIGRIVGIHSDPRHVFRYDDGEVRQEFSICFACKITGGTLQVSSESTAVEFFAAEGIADLRMHESIRIRIRDFLAAGPPVLR